MGLVLLTERYEQQITGVISCFDRIIFQGTLPKLSYARGITEYFCSHGLLLKDFTQWAEPLTQRIRDNAERLASEAGLEIQYLRKTTTDKEKLVQEILRERGNHPGLVCVFSVTERCSTYKPRWGAGRSPSLCSIEARCLHYYFYFIDEEFGLCFVRVPTWAPFRLEMYMNGHNWLARQMTRQQIGYTQVDNAFVWIQDPARAQELATQSMPAERLHRKLDDLAQTYCPVLEPLGMSFRWTIHQAEYATDVMFRRQADLQKLYEPLTRTVIHAVKARDVATFVGKRLCVNGEFDMGNRYDVRIEGTRVRHTMGPVSIKIYDKFGQVLRIETTINDVRFLPHYREVEQRNGKRILKFTKMKKSIYSFQALQTALWAANRRYLEFVSALELPLAGVRLLDRISGKLRQGERTYRGLNFFSSDDAALLETLGRGEFNLQGVRNKALRQHLPDLTAGQVSRTLKNLRLRGLIKKVGRTYKYYLTPIGKQVIATGLYLKSLRVVPMLSAA